LVFEVLTSRPTNTKLKYQDMRATKKKSNRYHLYSLYQRIKNSKDEDGKNVCCEEWRRNSESFYIWYENRAKEQKGLCEYCHLPGPTSTHYGGSFRKGKRGLHLEVDRKDAEGRYSPENCVLACYPCNNAKSDVFSYKEFLDIGKAIGKVKKRMA